MSWVRCPRVSALEEKQASVRAPRHRGTAAAPARGRFGAEGASGISRGVEVCSLVPPMSGSKAGRDSGRQAVAATGATGLRCEGRGRVDAIAGGWRPRPMEAVRVDGGLSQARLQDLDPRAVQAVADGSTGLPRDGG